MPYLLGARNYVVYNVYSLYFVLPHCQSGEFLTESEMGTILTSNGFTSLAALPVKCTFVSLAPLSLHWVPGSKET